MRRSAGRFALPGLGLLLALSSPVGARPGGAGGSTEGAEPAVDPAARAEAARLKGLADEAYLAGDFALALQRLQAAGRLDPDPRYVANQGLVHEQLGQYAEAVAALRAFLASDPPADKAAAARQVIERLEPPVTVSTVPPGATVQVVGEAEPRGKTPLVMRLVAGTHTLVLELEGHARWRQPAKVEPGDGLRVQAALAPLPAPPPPPPPPVREGLGFDGWGYITLGAGAVAGATGAVLYTLGVDAASSRDAARTGTEWDAAHRKVGLYDTSATVAWAVAGAALVAGVVLLSIDEQPAITLVPGPAGGLLFGRF